MKTPKVYEGIGVSPGVVIGPVVVYREETVIAAYCLIDLKAAEKEQARLEKAVTKSKEQLEAIREKIAREVNVDHSIIFDAQLLMLEDEAFYGMIRDLILNEKINAEWAVEKVNRRYLKAFENIDVEHLRERSYDIRDLSRRIINNLAENSVDSLQSPAEPAIIIARNLPPSYLSSLEGTKILGFATEVGGRTSHISLLAKSLGLPAVVGLHGIADEIDPDSIAIVDAEKGVLIVNPTMEQINKYRGKIKILQQAEKKLIKNRDLPAVTLDGFEVNLLANIDLPSEVKSAKEYGARGIGLFRSEFIFMQYPGRINDEEMHYNIYSALVKESSPYPATIRILDIGSDKYFGEQALYKETNPALGLRAIRLFLQNRDTIITQLRAMLRASTYGNLEILIPFISSTSEVDQTIEILAEIKNDFKKSRIPYNEDTKLGIMIEIPSAALIAEQLAEKVDFFSVGTNDLIQYTLAIDRSNENVSYLYRPLHPAILKLLSLVVNAGKNAGIPVAVCGEVAVDPVTVIVLLGMGYSTLSMNPASIPVIKNIIRSIKLSETQKIIEGILDLGTSKETEDFILQRIPNHLLQILNSATY